MDAGYSSDPTTASSRSFGRNNSQEDTLDNEEEEELQHHVPSFSSLHNRAHLQSTPAKTAASSARRVLHRVDRAGGSAIVQSSASELESQTEEEMEDNATELGGPRETDAVGGTRIREYWGRLLQEAEQSKSMMERQAQDGLGHLGVPAGRRQPPSTGSSTLVDQESLTGRGVVRKHTKENLPSTTLERPASAPPVTYDNTPGPSRPSPLQDHISRFISSTPSDPYIPARPPSPPSLSHDNSSRISSNNNNSSSAIASRVHDIFAKHIRSASTSSTARQPAASRGTERRLPPIQRLRDLLGESYPSNTRLPHARTSSSHQYTSESEGESIQEPQRSYKNSSTAARTSPKRRREGSNTPRAGPSQRLISKLPNTSASNSRSRIDPANDSTSRRDTQAERQDFDDAHRGLSQSRSPDSSRQYASRPNHSRRISGSLGKQELRPESPARRESHSITSQLSREWDSIRQQEQSRQYEEALDHIQGASQSEVGEQEQYSEEEYCTSGAEHEPRRQPLQSDSDPGYSPESELDPPQRADPQGGHGRTAETNPEEEASSLSQSEQEDGGQVSYVQQQRISPRLGTLSSFRRSTNGETSTLPEESIPSKGVRVATSTPRAASRTINRSFGNSTRAPKTPHPPGAYFSTTPSTTFVGGSPSRRQADEDPHIDWKGNETVEASRSRFLGGGNYSIAPKIPGGYSSPFPQPRKNAVQKDERDTARFSTPSKSRLSPQAHNSASPSRRSKHLDEKDQAGSPVRQRQSPRSVPQYDSPRGANVSSKSTVPILLTTPTKGTVSPEGTPRSRMQSGEITLNTMLTDLVKPLKNLLVGLHTPPKPVGSAIASSPKVKEEDILDNDDTLVERKKRRLEHDHILARLSEADRIDRSLATRIDEMRKAVDEMGQRLSSQVSSVLTESFVQEAKRRKLWFSLLILLQLLLLYLIFSYANARANQLHQTTYFDPFFPALLDPNYHESRTSSSSSFFRASHPLYSSSSFETSSGTHNSDNEKSWYTFLTVFQYALYAIRDNLGLGGRTDFVHGTFQNTVTKAVTAAASDTTTVLRIPT